MAASLKVTAARCRQLILEAEDCDLIIDEGNVIDLLADNITDVSLLHLRLALGASGLGSRFPKAVRGPNGR